MQRSASHAVLRDSLQDMLFDIKLRKALWLLCGKALPRQREVSRQYLQWYRMGRREPHVVFCMSPYLPAARNVLDCFLHLQRPLPYACFFVSCWGPCHWKA